MKDALKCTIQTNWKVKCSTNTFDTRNSVLFKGSSIILASENLPVKGRWRLVRTLMTLQVMMLLVCCTLRYAEQRWSCCLSPSEESSHCTLTNSIMPQQRKGTVLNPRESTISNKKKKDATASRPEGAKTRPRRGIGEPPHVEVTEKPIVGKLKPSSGAGTSATSNILSLPHHALARRAVGRGVRHSFAVPATRLTTESSSGTTTGAISRSTQADVPKSVEPGTADGLSQLAINYCNVLNQDKSSANSSQNSADPTPLSEMQGQNNESACLFEGFLSRNSSLVDLAMIAPVDADSQELSDYLSEGFGFIDFPNPEVHPANRGSTAGDKT